MGAKRAGKAQVSLARALADAGYDVNPKDIRQKRGSSGNGHHVAAWGWEALARSRRDGAPRLLRCWDTVGACVGRGIAVDGDSGPSSTVVARARGR